MKTSNGTGSGPQLHPLQFLATRVAGMRIC